MHSRFYSSLSVPLSLNHWQSFFNSRNWWDVMQNTCSYYFNTCWCNCPTELSVCVFVYCLSLSVAFASLLNCLIKLCYELKVKTVFTHVVVDNLLFIHSISILVFIFAFLLLCWNFVTVFSLHATDMIHFGIDITTLLLVLFFLMPLITSFFATSYNNCWIGAAWVCCVFSLYLSLDSLTYAIEYREEKKCQVEIHLVWNT